MSATTVLHFRDALESDIDAILSIYGHAVLHGIGTFEEVVPSREEMIARMEKVHGQRNPWIVAELPEEGVIGYAYASQLRDRIAFRFAVEDSIYLDPRIAGRGHGRALLTELLRRITETPATQIIAVIGGGHENVASVRLHTSLGFQPAGELKSVGFKFNRWLDSLWMQRVVR